MADNKLGTLAIYLTANSKGLERGFAQATSMVKKFAGFTLAALGVNSLRSFAMESINLYGIQEQNERKLERVLAATGNAVGFNAQQLKDYASELQGMTTTGDEEILKHQSLLLAFTGVVGDEFKRAMALALDMSEVIGNGVPENVKKLGRSLQEPLSALTGLAEIGVKFSLQQQEQIKSLVAAGKTREAQLIILAELEKRYGGAASAAADTTNGRITQMKNAWGDLKEEIGRVIAETVSIKTATGGLANQFSEWATALKTNALEIAYSFQEVWTNISSGTQMIWAIVSPVVLGITDLFTSGFKIIFDAGFWLGENLGKIFENFLDIAKAVGLDMLNIWLYVPKQILKAFGSLGKGIWQAIKTGDIRGAIHNALMEIGESVVTGFGDFWNNSKRAFARAGTTPFPEWQGPNYEKIFGRFSDVGSTLDQIERERRKRLDDLASELRDRLTPKSKSNNGNEDGTPISGNVIKMVTTAARGSLEAYQARLNTGKDLNREMLNTANKQLETQGSILERLDVLGNRDDISFANIGGIK